ncbi:MAG: hypothetical protein IJD12_02440 [Tidjanibacter sp.]|nr:hypothetical protein [Tidjanibacter sp.]
MKKFFVVAVAICTSFAVEAQIVKNNLFAGYAAGDKLEKQEYAEKNSPILVDTWSRGVMNSTDIQSHTAYVTDGLTYEGYNEQGLAIKMGSSFDEGARGRRPAIYSLTAGKEYRKDALYLAFLVNFEKTDAKNPSEVVALSTNYAGGGNRGTFFVARNEMDKTKLHFGVSLTKEIAVAPATYEVGQTYLVVIKVDYSTATASLFVNPDLNGVEPEAVAVADAGESGFKHAIRAISYRDRNSYKGRIGNFRLTKSWEALAE